MMEEKKHIAIIGGGPAGLESAENLFDLGYKVTIIELSDSLGGKLNNWHRLFPDRRLSKEILNHLKNKLNRNIQIFYNSTVIKTTRKEDKFFIELNNSSSLECDAVLLTVGFDLFNASIKEEYGYGIYDNVITSADLEYLFHANKPLLTKQGKTPEKVAFIHCVGSRDEKVGNIYCSSVCCVTGVKQAMEVKQLLPHSEILMFYMDIRMYGRFYEDLYLEAQEKYHVQFIRGRLSETAENIDGSLILKADDTLAGCPIKVNADLVVLLVGYVPSKYCSSLSKMLHIKCEKDGFFAPCDTHTDRNFTGSPGIFIAGACTGPKNLEATLADARSASITIHKYLLHVPVLEQINKVG